MRYVVISDIHGNCAALEAVRNLLPSLLPDGILFLGDYVTDGSDPQRILRNLREIQEEYPCSLILGNREEYFLKNRYHPDPSWQPCSHTGSLWYTARHLTEKDLDWFASLPVSKVIHSAEGMDFMICHGSPMSAFDSMLGQKNRERREQMVRSIEQDLLLCGHTHRQERYDIDDSKTVLFCPSIGLPILRNNQTMTDHITIMDSAPDGYWQFRFMRISYDLEGYIRNVENSAFAEAAGVWCRGLVHTLRTQRNTTADCLRLVCQIAEKDGYTGAVPFPEKYWLAAADQLGI